jgi:eukaryotic-like serine/threonine-protein kinase
MIGQYVQNYQIIAHLGEGGMGVVYKATDSILGREVALKMLHTSMTRQPQVLERFKKEAQVLARLLHPNIAVIYNFIEQQGQFFMVMEYVEGKNLDALARSHTGLPHTVIASMFIQALEGLQHAHKKGIFHRDIKPSNLILTPEGTVKLMDFGIAKIAGEQRLTQVNRVIGTVEFMAPELIEGKEPSVASDIYAAGITMYEMLSGRLPFESNSDYTLMQDILKKKPALLNTINPAVPAALSKVVMKALEKNPENRFVSARDFQQALIGVVPAYREVDLSPLTAHTLPALLPGMAAATQWSDIHRTGNAQATRLEAPATALQQIDQKVLRNKKLPYILTGTGILALLIVFAVIFLGKRSDSAAADLSNKKIDSVPAVKENHLVANNQTPPEKELQPSHTLQNTGPLQLVIPATPQEKQATLKKEIKKKQPELTEKANKEALTAKNPDPEPTPVEKPAEKTNIVIEDKIVVALRMRETISNNEDDREQQVSFTVSSPVMVKGITIIREGAIAKGRVKLGRILSTVDITSVMAANGQEIALRERDHRKVKNLASERDYTAVLLKGTRMNF